MNRIGLNEEGLNVREEFDKRHIEELQVFDTHGQSRNTLYWLGYAIDHGNYACIWDAASLKEVF